MLVLKRAAELIKQVSGATIGAVTDIYPQPVENTIVQLKYHYLKKLSGKNYHSEAVKNILMALGFDVLKMPLMNCGCKYLIINLILHCLQTL
ncbi:MAG: hypothetical protein IPH56_06665 [Chitinophagaceae bacterium]|nr:hypothetical protein [Chitinophagaceae bacterium]